MRRGNSPQLFTQAIKFGPKFNLLDSSILLLVEQLDLPLAFELGQLVLIFLLPRSCRIQLLYLSAAFDSNS